MGVRKKKKSKVKAFERSIKTAFGTKGSKAKVVKASAKKKFLKRAKSSLGLSRSEAARAIAKEFGAENVSQRGGDTFFRGGKGKPFKSLRKSGAKKKAKKK
jgi:hypothetical protein